MTDHSDELDGVRIRQIAAARRAAYRVRSYCIIAAFAFAIVVIQLVWMTTTAIRTTGLTSFAVGYLLLATCACMGAVYFLRRAVSLHRETKASAMTPASAQPDFSTLGDGSSRWKHLEDIH